MIHEQSLTIGRIVRLGEFQSQGTDRKVKCVRALGRQPQTLSFLVQQVFLMNLAGLFE